MLLITVQNMQLKPIAAVDNDVHGVSVAYLKLMAMFMGYPSHICKVNVVVREVPFAYLQS